MARSDGRGVRLAALALASGTLVMAGAGGAAAATPGTQQFTALAGGSALELKVYLPADVPGLTVNHLLDIKISLTNGTATLNGVTRAISTTANLANTSSTLLNGVLDKSTAASLGGATSQQTSVMGPQALPLSLGTVAVGPVSSAIGALTGADLIGKSSSQLVGLTLVPTGIPGATAVTAPLTSTVSQAVSTVNGTVGTLTTAVNGAVNQLNSAAQGAATPAVTAVQSVESGLTSALSSVQTTLANLSAAPALVTLTGVTQAHDMTRAGNAISAASSASIADLNVLGGLVSLQGLQSAVTATAGGTPGSAAVNFPAQPVLHLSVANGALSFLVDATGIHLQGALSAIPSSLQNTVNGALGDLNGLLDTVAGVHVTYGKGTSSVSPDGTAATGAVSATTLTVDPAVLHTAGLIPAGQPFMTVSFVPVNASVADRLVPAAVTPAVVITTPVHRLAYTGAELPLTAAVASALVGAAAVLRRRRRATA